MGTAPSDRDRIREYAAHSREWRDNLYVYPVISRRSGGLSVGVNLNPDTACNFDCIYCQVDRSAPEAGRIVELSRLRRELGCMLAWAADGSIFTHTRFGHVPRELQRVNDIAFSGDGEPTTCPVFAEAVDLAAELKGTFGLGDVKIVLITNACYLTKPAVKGALAVMDNHQGEIWAKLDAGTEAHFQRVNRSRFTLAHVMENIISAARDRPVCIQSLFMRIDGQPPAEEEIAAYVARLQEVVAARGAIKLVQVYTVARLPAEAFVSALSAAEVDAISRRVREATGLPTQAYYGG